MNLDMETIGYFLYMEEQEEKNRSGDEDIDQEKEEKGEYNNG